MFIVLVMQFAFQNQCHMLDIVTCIILSCSMLSVRVARLEGSSDLFSFVSFPLILALVIVDNKVKICTRNAAAV